MARSLVFDCPLTNIAVITRVQLGSLTRQRALELSCEVACPCGRHHVFPLSQSKFFERDFATTPHGFRQTWLTPDLHR